MRFRGREMEHQNLGFNLLKKLTEEVVEHSQKLKFILSLKVSKL